MGIQLLTHNQSIYSPLIVNSAQNAFPRMQLARVNPTTRNSCGNDSIFFQICIERLSTCLVIMS